MSHFGEKQNGHRCLLSNFMDCSCPTPLALQTRINQHDFMIILLNQVRIIQQTISLKCGSRTEYLDDNTHKHSSYYFIEKGFDERE